MPEGDTDRPRLGVAASPEGGRELRFRNVFRWSAVGEALRLEHLRFGVAHPVFLFDLAPVAAGEWRSVSPHL